MYILIIHIFMYNYIECIYIQFIYLYIQFTPLRTPLRTKRRGALKRRQTCSCVRQTCSYLTDINVTRRHRMMPASDPEQ